MRKYILVLLSLICVHNLQASEITLPPLQITEEDGDPIVYSPYKIKFSNGAVTDNGDGTVSVAGGSGGSGDISSVGDATSGAAFDGTSDGGTYLDFYNPQGATRLIVGDNSSACTVTLPTTSGTLINAETDPIYSAWDKSTGISITASQVSDFDTEVSNNTDVTANTAKVTESTTVTTPLVKTGYDISIPAASSTANGYLSSADWTTFNNKVGAETDPIVGAISGIVKADGAGNISAATAGTDYTNLGNTIEESELNLTDVTTGNFSTSRHGFVPKGTNTGKFLKDDGTWDSPTGSGDVVGPSSAISNNVVFFDGTTGKLIKDSGLTLSGSNTGDQDLSGLALKSTTISTTAPLSGGGDLSANRTLSIPAATSSVNGYLSYTDWNTFNNKEDSISAGTTSQYWRGDKSWQTLDTSVVPENTNLYYTEARVSANSDVAANTAKVTESTTVTAPLVLMGYNISIPVATSTTNGYLSSTDWNTFNSKVGTESDPIASAINGILKSDGTTISAATSGTDYTNIGNTVEGSEITDGTITHTDVSSSDSLRTGAIEFIIDGNGSAVTTGIKGDIEVPFDCTIQQVTMLADQSGSIAVDIWKDTYANFAPTDADSITASATPTISSSIKSQDSTLTGWTTSISAGDILRFNVDSASTITRVIISIKVRKD